MSFEPDIATLTFSLNQAFIPWSKKIIDKKVILSEGIKVITVINIVILVCRFEDRLFFFFFLSFLLLSILRTLKEVRKISRTIIKISVSKRFDIRE
tara:strand:- start:413 stop:700 length:288 start_codon:yes stop_codon:yes gene_type:complete